MPYPQDLNQISNWVGSMPNYAGGYHNLLGNNTTPLSLGRIISMINEIQGSYANRMPNTGVAGPIMSEVPTTAQIPAQIANAIMSQQSRLLSLPRMRYADSGFNDPEVSEPPPQTGPDNTSIYSGGGSGKDSGGGSSISNWSPSNTNTGMTGAQGLASAQAPNNYTSPTQPPSNKNYVNPNTGAWAGGVAGGIWR